MRERERERERERGGERKKEERFIIASHIILRSVAQGMNQQFWRLDFYLGGTTRAGKARVIGGGDVVVREALW